MSRQPSLYPTQNKHQDLQSPFPCPPTTGPSNSNYDSRLLHVQRVDHSRIRDAEGVSTVDLKSPPPIQPYREMAKFTAWLPFAFQYLD